MGICLFTGHLHKGPAPHAEWPCHYSGKPQVLIIILGWKEADFCRFVTQNNLQKPPLRKGSEVFLHPKRRKYEEQ